MRRGQRSALRDEAAAAGGGSSGRISSSSCCVQVTLVRRGSASQVFTQLSQGS